MVKLGKKIGPDIFLLIEEGVCNCHLGGCIIRLNLICFKIHLFLQETKLRMRMPFLFNEELEIENGHV